MLDPALDTAEPALGVLDQLAAHPLIRVFGPQHEWMENLQIQAVDDDEVEIAVEEKTSTWTTRANWGSYRPVLPGAARRLGCSTEELLAAIRARCIAVAARMDLFMTRNWLLLPRNRLDFPPVSLLNGHLPRECLAAIGLYLRTRSDFTVRAVGRGRTLYTEDSFFQVAGEMQLPALQSHRPQAARDRRVAHLYHSLAVRAERVLRYRDRVHVANQATVTRHSSGAEMAAFESVLYQLLGAFDAAEKLAMLALEPGADIDKPIRRPLRKLAASHSSEDPAARAINDVLQAASWKRARESIAAMRNTIHGRAILSAYLRDLGQSRRSWLAYDKANDRDGHLENLLREEEPWIVHELATELDGALLLDPSGLTEVLCVKGFKEVNRLLAAIANASTALGGEPEHQPDASGPLVSSMIGLALPTCQDDLSKDDLWALRCEVRTRPPAVTRHQSSMPAVAVEEPWRRGGMVRKQPPIRHLQ